MTPAIKLLKKQKVPHTIHEYKHDSSVHSYGEEAAQKMGVDPKRVFKTLVVQSDKMMAVGIVPVSSTLNLKSMAKALGVKKVAMADPKNVENTTGYILGGVSPLGQKKRLKTLIDESAFEYESIFVSAGKRGLEVEVDPKDLEKLLQADKAKIAEN
jgi:Cys-tRNA(Pro)/Cys-tRNA(Cys) deacylase